MKYKEFLSNLEVNLAKTYTSLKTDSQIRAEHDTYHKVIGREQLIEMHPVLKGFFGGD